MSIIYISSKDLIENLSISDQYLIDIEAVFDADPHDEWELKIDEDYRIVNHTSGLREYKISGAYAIAKYLEKNQKINLRSRIKEWFSNTQRDVQRASIRRKILDNSSSLDLRGNHFFMSSSDVISIFATKPSYFKKMVESAQRTDMPLIKGEDYDNFGDAIHYSLAGVGKLAEQFKANLTQQNRRDWCKDVGELINPQINDIRKQILKRDKDITKAKDEAKKRDKKSCRLTHESGTKIYPVNLAVHHLYSQSEYPHLASFPDNLITILESVHNSFHLYFMGGNQVPCTIDDFIRFATEKYPDNNEIVIWLTERKLIMGEQKPKDHRKPHVLYLPINRVS
jgi:5-methylcytosine-specific restriction endonuclease McrA